MKVLAAETGLTVQQLVARGLDAAFAEHGKPEIASGR